MIYHYATGKMEERLIQAGKTPLYYTIFQSLMQRIHEGELREGDRIPTEKELMESYSTSRITASRAVKELENLGYVKRVKAKGTFVSSRSFWRDHASDSHSAAKPFISIVFPAPAGKVSLTMEVLHGVEIACRKRGFALSVTSIDTEVTSGKAPIEIEKELISEVIESGAQGAIVYPYSTRSSPEAYNRMIRSSFPFVLVDRRVFGVEAPIVSADNRRGYYSMIELLVSKGHRRIAFVSGNTYESSCRSDRFAGYLQAMNDFKLEVDDDCIVHNLVSYDYNTVFYDQKIAGSTSLRSSVRSMLERFLKLQDPPSVVTATNDYIALNVLNVAREMGIRVPEDLSVTGFDGLPVCSLFTPKLTTVAQPFSEMGSTAVKLLSRILDDPRRKTETVLLPAELIPGESVKDLLPGS